jgi:hypothetical protein
LEKQWRKALMTNKRTENEKKFRSWNELLDGGRRYFYEVQGKHGWRAQYVKEVDRSEQTIKFTRRYMIKRETWWKSTKNFLKTVAIGK